jgi:uncharacterized sporulation protein YeaH/YhbH (DUF444 family)
MVYENTKELLSASMSNYTIIDRRVNPKGKNLSNRQRFLHRTKEWIKKKVQERSVDRKITSNDGESISVSNDDIAEPTFDYNRSVGDWERILPGNKEFITGDKIKRSGGGGKGKGKEASDSGEGEDEFVFTISKEEYLDILFEDLELPDLVKQSEAAAITFTRKRTGFSTSGSPNNLDLERSFRNALGRRIALGFPIDKKIKNKEEELDITDDTDNKAKLIEEIKILKSRRAAITFIDQMDVRYKRYSNTPVPNCQAVVFCLMDVSGSMGEKEKETAKRFFLLLYLFLQRKYQKVDIVFVRHTTEASECTEEEFFYDKETGGTMVSTGVKEVNDIIRARYALDAWNLYCVQASDGDNFDHDNAALIDELEILIPKCQYYVYNEVLQDGSYASGRETNVHEVMEKLSQEHANLSVVSIGSVDNVVPTFRKIFTKKTNNGK